MPEFWVDVFFQAFIRILLWSPTGTPFPRPWCLQSWIVQPDFNNIRETRGSDNLLIADPSPTLQSKYYSLFFLLTTLPNFCPIMHKKFNLQTFVFFYFQYPTAMRNNNKQSWLNWNQVNAKIIKILIHETNKQ